MSIPSSESLTSLSPLLIANRGEIACRVIETARKLGIQTIAVCSTADEASRHVAEADSYHVIGPPPPAESYLDIASIMRAATFGGARAVHPGYGFLAESAPFARAVEAAGMTWVGPSPESIATVGDKNAARSRMAEADVPVGAGGPVADDSDAVALAAEIGFPVMLKASAGGGGIGMHIIEDPAALLPAIDKARDQALRFFGGGGLLLEKYYPDARHIEVQILGMPDGQVVTFLERDCSVQRRHQKVVEETPAPGIGEELRERLQTAASEGARAIGYQNAGTFEFLLHGDEFSFLEVNARIQVEHPVTEAVHGVDLVEQQLRIAGGGTRTPTLDDAQPKGHAIELRVYAEDPQRFLPRPGPVTEWIEPTGDGIRVDSGYRKGDEITPFYDPLLAKVVAWGQSRPDAILRARRAAGEFVIDGVETNLPFLEEVLTTPSFVQGAYTTNLVSMMRS